MIPLTRFVPLLVSAALFARAQDFQALEQKVSDFTLPNGFRFLVIERHDAPVISFVTHVAAGTANDPPGATGLARLFERIAYSGTESIGTRDAAAEKKAIDAAEEAWERYDAERARGRLANDVNLVRLQIEAQRATEAAWRLGAPDQFRTALEEGGATAIAASAAMDSTQYRLTLPSNRAELWFLLEAQRLSRPVFRDFYRQRDAAAAEQRARVERNAQSTLLQALGAAAFTAHPYRTPSYGWPGDLANLRQAEARQFFQRYYTPGNITLAIAGDIRPDEARRLAEKHFGPIAAPPTAPPRQSQEPPQTGPRTVVVENALEPLLAIGFKRPDQYDGDDLALDVAQAALAGSRQSLLTKELVETKRTAVDVRVTATWPGGRSPHLFTIVVAPAPGHSAEENEKAVTAVIARLQAEPLDEATITRARAQARAALVERLTENTSIASLLAGYAAEHGDWRKLFAAAAAFPKITAARVQTAALKHFQPSRRTSVLMVPPVPVVRETAKGAK